MRHTVLLTALAVFAPIDAHAQDLSGELLSCSVNQECNLTGECRSSAELDQGDQAVQFLTLSEFGTDPSPRPSIFFLEGDRYRQVTENEQSIRSWEGGTTFNTFQFAPNWDRQNTRPFLWIVIPTQDVDPNDPSSGVLVRTGLCSF